MELEMKIRFLIRTYLMKQVRTAVSIISLTVTSQRLAGDLIGKKNIMVRNGL